jgi:S1-C subfamily serine protease
MDAEGPDPARGAPDDHEGHDDAPLRGWISPDDRLWRHPSEVAATGASASAPALSSRRDRTTVLAVGAAGAAAVVLTMAAAFAMAGTGTSGTTSSLAATMTSLTTTSSRASSVPTSTLVAGRSSSSNVIALVDALRPSLVGVEPTDATGTGTSSTSPPTLTGIVLPGGKLVATAASAVVGMHVVDVVTADGHVHRGTLAGSDSRSGVAVVALTDTLPAATFADGEMAPGASAVAVCLCGHDPAAALPSISTGLVQATGEPAELSDGTDLLDVVQVSVPLSPSAWGAVLLDGQGQVAGLLDGQTQSDGKDMGLFVPAPLAVAVADALVAGTLSHGWLGVVCSDPGTGSDGGPVVTTVFAGGPAAGAGVRPGDVVTAVDGFPVATIAELQARLYPLAPGASVRLDLQRASGTQSVGVTLTAEPA